MSGRGGPVVTVDLDGTLLPGDTAFAAILRESGHGEAVARSDARYFSGEISLEECFWEQWTRVRGLSLADMHRALRKADWLPDIGAGVARLKDAGWQVFLLTDQPSTVTDFLGRWGFDGAVCSPVTIEEGRQVAVDARFDKATNLEAARRDWHVPLSAITHVGNGTNDVPVWQAVGRGIAVFAPPEVARHADQDLGAVRSFQVVVDALLD